MAGDQSWGAQPSAGAGSSGGSGPSWGAGNEPAAPPGGWSGGSSGGFGSGGFGSGGFGSGGGGGDPSSPFGGFGGTSSPAAAPAAPAGPPWPWLVGSIVLAVAGSLLAVFWGGAVLRAGLGWLLGGPLAIALLAVYLHLDIARRARPIRIDYRWSAPLYVGAVVLALLAVVLSSVRLADWFGRL